MPDEETIEALRKLILDLVGIFGPWPTLAIIGTIVTLVVARRLYNDSRADKETNALVDEKEKSVQRLATENREQRILIARQVYKWTPEEIERYILRAEFRNGAEAREALEAPNGEKERNHG